MDSQIREFIIKTFLFGEGQKLTDKTALLDSGIVDSTGLLEIIQFIETAFNITVEEHELTPANLNSVENLVRFINGKRTKAP
jgi:acyl carrier protein